MSTVFAGFHFVKKKPPEKYDSNFAKKILSEKKKTEKLTSEQMHFYKLKEARSTSSLQIEAEYNQRDAKSVMLLHQNRSNGTKVYF